MKSCAISQPAFFPYLGYYQLVGHVDTFVSYTDVTYMKGKWINRNRVASVNGEILFTVPVSDVSSNRIIRNTEIAENEFKTWAGKFLRMLEHEYRSAPHREVTLDLIQRVLAKRGRTIDTICHRSISAVFEYLGIHKNIVDSSSYSNSELGRIDRIIDICRKEGAEKYVNSSGGTTLYNWKIFDDRGIALWFIRPTHHSYRQFQIRAKGSFRPCMSIIDILMNCQKEEIHELLSCHELFRPSLV